MIHPPDYVLGIQPYVPGKPLEELERELGISNSIKLASNENPVGPSPAAVRALQGAFTDINRYPDGAGYYLKQALASRLNVSEDELILGNGSNELLDIAVRTFMKAGDAAIMAVPSFVVYAMAVQSVGGRPIEVPLKDFTHDLAAMADAITADTKMLFIANPNNPTGTINRKAEFTALMDRVTDDMLVVLDEAYYEYVTEVDYADSMKYLPSDKNVLILRTFSKVYGLAGLRIGYGIGKKEILNDMNRIREPFNTNAMAQKAALAALGDDEHVIRSREVNETGKKYLYKELEALGMCYVPTHANFIFMPVEDSITIYNELLKKGVIIRPMGSKAIRVTIGLADENFRFIAALRHMKSKQ